MLTSGFASRNSNRVTSSGTVSLSSKPAEKISAGDDILHAQAWQGIVQIENVIVKPYGDTTLKALEDEGFCMQEDDYDQLASTEELYLEKEGVEVALKIIRDETAPATYRDSRIAYVSSVSFSEKEKDCGVQVWVHDGIKMGDSIDQLTEKYDTAVYNAGKKTYQLHPISFAWERNPEEGHGGYGAFDIEIDYQIDKNLNFIKYNFIGADTLETLSESIPYQTQRVNERFHADHHSTFQAPTADKEYWGYHYRFCTDGEKAAKYRCSVHNLKQIDPSVCTVEYQTDEYTVYREVNVAYADKKFSILRNDDQTGGYGLNFELEILDSDGYIVNSNEEMSALTVYGYQKYELEKGQQYVDFDSYPNGSDAPYAYTVAIDIFEHLSQYSVEAGYVEPT